MRKLGATAARPGPFSLYQPTRQQPVYQSPYLLHNDQLLCGFNLPIRGFKSNQFNSKLARLNSCQVMKFLACYFSFKSSVFTMFICNFVSSFVCKYVCSLANLRKKTIDLSS